MTAVPSPHSAGQSSVVSTVLTGMVQRIPNGSQLFRDEVDRAVERGGGHEAIEERLADASDARRADRSNGFERYRSDLQEREREPRRRRGDGSDEAPDALPQTSGRVEEPRTSKPASEARNAPVEASARSGDADGKSNQDTPNPAAEPVPAGPAQVGATQTVNASSAAPDASRLAASAARTATAARPVDGTNAFLSGARGDREPANATGKLAASAPAGATPDTELIEQAAEVLKQIRLSLTRGAKEVTVQLSPADLGRLSIRMRMADGKLSTVVRVENERTLELLDRQTPELRAVLAGQGFETEQLDIELGFGAHAKGEQPNEKSFTARAETSNDDGAGATAPRPDQPARVTTTHEGSLDTYA